MTTQPAPVYPDPFETLAESAAVYNLRAKFAASKGATEVRPTDPLFSDLIAQAEGAGYSIEAHIVSNKSALAVMAAELEATQTALEKALALLRTFAQFAGQLPEHCAVAAVAENGHIVYLKNDHFRQARELVAANTEPK